MKTGYPFSLTRFGATEKSWIPCNMQACLCADIDIGKRYSIHHHLLEAISETANAL